MIFILGGLALAVLFYYYLVKKPFNYWRDRGVDQGSPIWGLGDTWKAVVKIQTASDNVSELYNRFPGTRYTGVYQFFEPTLMIKDPELIKQVTIKDFDHFLDHREFVPVDIDPLWGKNLLVLQGQKWHEMRSLLSPTFTSSKLKAMFGLIRDCAENLVDHYLKQNQEVCKIEAKDLFTRITNDVIATTSFGININSLTQPENTFYKMGKVLTDFTSVRAKIALLGSLVYKNLHKITRMPLFGKEVRTYFQDLIDESVKVREENNIKRPDMITLMVQARKGEKKHANGVSTAELSKEKSLGDLTNEDIAAQAMVFFFGGFDSVSSLMCFSAYELALHKDVQDRLRQEIFDTLKECGGEVTYDGITKMKYMDMVLSESLRKWPNFVSTDRVCSKDYIIEPTTPDEKPLFIKKDTSLILPIYGIHHDPKYYPNPEKFDPERFNEENKRNINPYAYFSFGMGPRICIGARFAQVETKTVLFYILANFEIVPVKETDIPVKISKAHFNMQPDGLWLGLKRINKQKV